MLPASAGTTSRTVTRRTRRSTRDVSSPHIPTWHGPHLECVVVEHGVLTRHWHDTPLLLRFLAGPAAPSSSEPALVLPASGLTPRRLATLLDGTSTTCSAAAPATASAASNQLGHPPAKIGLPPAPEGTVCMNYMNLGGFLCD